MTDTPICNVENARKMSLLFNIPKTRYNNLDTSPYTNGGFTKYELDMRRKSEILKYNRNNGTLTKKQNWRQIVTGTGPSSRQFSQTQVQQGNIDLAGCDNLDNLPSLSRNAGIPGPNFLIYLDKNVPLYNLTNSITNAYGVENKIPTEEYTIVSNYDQISIDLNGNNIHNNLFELYIQPSINSIYKIFSVSIPIVIAITGIVNTGTSVPPKFSIGAFETNRFKLNVLFGGNLTTAYSDKPIYSFETGSVNANGIVIKPINTGGTVFSALLFLGNLKVSNIWLPTAVNFSYEFQLNYSFTGINISQTSIDSYNVQIIGNNFSIISDTINPKKILTNCSVFLSNETTVWTPSTLPNKVSFVETSL